MLICQEESDVAFVFTEEAQNPLSGDVYVQTLTFLRGKRDTYADIVIICATLG